MPKVSITICVALIAYLIGDFFIFNGPLHQSLERLHPDSPQALEKAHKAGMIAKIGQRSITSSQLERALTVRLTLAGKAVSELSPEELKSARKGALRELIENELLEVKIQAHQPPIDVSSEEIDHRLVTLNAQFGGEELLKDATKTQGIASMDDLRQRIRGQIKAEKYFTSQMPQPPTDAEAQAWYSIHGESLAYLERVEARHIFIPAFQSSAEEAKKTLEDALAKLAAKEKDFPTLAKELSQDPTSKEQGGNLGWMTRARLSSDLATPLFSLPVGQPTLVRTHLGWHLLEVTGRKASEPRPFEDAKGEIIATLDAMKRQETIKAYRKKLWKTPPVPIRILEPELTE